MLYLGNVLLPPCQFGPFPACPKYVINKAIQYYWILTPILFAPFDASLSSPPSQLDSWFTHAPDPSVSLPASFCFGTKFAFTRVLE